MSLPPTLFPKASAAGIVDTHSGDRVVAASRRPDGTYRKELKIRPGFTPDEDVKRYRAKMAAESDARSAIKGKVPGLTPPSGQVQAALAGMTKAQKKNANRKKKRAEDGGEGEKDEDVPEDWDEGEADGEKIKSTGNEDKGKNAEIASTIPAPTPTPAPAPALVTTPATTVPESSKVRALKKKIRQAEQLKERESMGLYLPPSERAKIKGIPDLEEELKKMSLEEA